MINGKAFVAAIIMCLILPLAGASQIASGGVYTLEKTVVAGGGGKSVGAAIEVESTVGQTAVGPQMSNGAYSLAGGFWTPASFGPTAANVPVSGRILSDESKGLGNVLVSLNGGILTSPLSTFTNNFGYFRFEGIAVGHFYVLTVKSKGNTFEPDTYSFQLWDEVTDIVFQASETGQKN